MQHRKINGLLFLLAMVLFAVGSGESGPKRHELLAKKYNISEADAKACIDAFAADADEILNWISKQKGFLGFFKKDCTDLKKEISVYGSVDALLYGLNKGLKPNDPAIKNYIAEREKNAEEERRAKAEQEIQKRIAKEKEAQQALEKKPRAAIKCDDNFEFYMANGVGAYRYGSDKFKVINYLKVSDLEVSFDEFLGYGVTSSYSINRTNLQLSFTITSPSYDRPGQSNKDYRRSSCNIIPNVDPVKIVSDIVQKDKEHTEKRNKELENDLQNKINSRKF